MKITIKLFAHLAQYLPQEAKRNVSILNLPQGATVADVIEELKIPIAECHLVLVNGLYIAPEARSSTELSDGQALAIWPLIAGG